MLSEGWISHTSDRIRTIDAHGSVLGYGLATVSVTLALLLTFLLSPLVDVPLFPLFLAAILISAWAGGWGPGLCATGLSALLTWYFFVSPLYSFAVVLDGEVVRFWVFVSVAALINWLVAKGRSSEAALRKSEVRYRNLVENTSDAIISVASDGTVTLVNRGFERLTGWSRQVVVGQPYDTLVVASSHALLDRWLKRALSGFSESTVLDIDFYSSNKKEISLELRASVLRDESGELKGFELIARDVSARKALEQRQTEFLAMLSHEIRTPLGVIMGYVEMLSDELAKEENPTIPDILAPLTRNARMLRFLITNYLDFSRMETGAVKLVRQPLQLNDLLRHVIQEYEPEAERRTIALQLQAQEPLPPILGDGIALERVFGNLLHNALKFTPKGGKVAVTSTLANAAVCVAVADSGPGIPSGELSSLFEKYYRAKSSVSVDGSGLGLYIVKKSVDAHGGRVEAVNTPGSGSCFHVWLPLAERGSDMLVSTSS